MSLTLFTSLMAGGAQAQVKPCEELRDEIAAKIYNNGVPAFDLFILARDEETDLKIVGTCNAGRGKIAYARGTRSEQAAAARARAAARAEALALAPSVKDEVVPGRGTTDTAPSGQAPKASVPPAEQAHSTVPAVPGVPAASAASALPDVPPPTKAIVAPVDGPGAALWASGEVRQCHLVAPKGWVVDRVINGDQAAVPAPGTAIREFESEVLPPAEHDLAAKHVVFSFRIRPLYLHELRPVMMAAYSDVAGFNAMLAEPVSALGGDALDFRRSTASHAAASSDEWKRARAVANPGLIDAVGAVRLHVPGDVEWKPIDAMRFRAHDSLAGEAVTTHRIRTWTNGHALRTQAVISPLSPAAAPAPAAAGKSAGGAAAGEGALSKRLVYEYGCWASNTMSPDDFGSLCSAFIERSTLASQFPAARCVTTREGLAFAPR